MKPFEQLTSWTPTSTLEPPTPESCAALLIEAVPRVMRTVRSAIGGLESASLTIPQFRTLHFVQEHSGASLSAVAEFLGLTLPSTSKLVDHMVKQGILARHDDASDRRRMTLRLTTRGSALLKGADAQVRRELAAVLLKLELAELQTLQQALAVLQATFGHATDAGGNVQGESRQNGEHRSPRAARRNERSNS